MEITNKLLILPTAIFFLLLISGIVSAAETTLEPGDSIQTAITNASSGDTIILKAGTYTENLNIIAKSDLTIKSESGNPDDTIINAKVTTKNTIYVNASSNIVIQGIGVTGGSVSSYAGIYLHLCSGCTLENNKVTNQGYGIRLYQSNTSTLSGNTANDNIAYGIYLGNSKKNVISGNTIDSNYDGLYLGASDYNTISGNYVTNSEYRGFYECSECDYNTIYNNYFNNTKISVNGGTGNSYNITKTEGTNIIGGAYIGGNYWGKPDGTGFSDTAVDSDGDGISDSVYAISSEYTDYLPLVGTSSSDSSSSESTAPTADFSSSVDSGNAPLDVIFTDLSTGDPTSWSWDLGDGNTSQDQNPEHIYYSAGSYTVTLTASNGNGESSKSSTITVTNTGTVIPVADFSTNATQGYAPLAIQFTDLSQNATEWNWDFGDGSSSTDQNPVHVYENTGEYTVSLTAKNENGEASKTLDITVLEKEGLPVADFEANVTSGYAPLSVLFTDLSQNADQIGWDFNEDGIIDESNSTAVYEFTSTGTYTVSLTATNENGSVSKTMTIDVNKKSSGGSSHSSGSSGGGAGGSPEPQSNVEVKELSQVFIANGKAIQFDFAKNATCVVYVGFDAKKTVGKTTTIAEQLKNKSTLVTNLTDGEVYKYFNVWVGNSGYVSSENVENPVICFKVEKSWLEENNVDQDSITLNRYNDDEEWEQLPVSLLNEDSEYLYYTADVSEYSFFAITGTAAAKQVDNETESTQIAAEERSAGEIQSKDNETQKPESTTDNREIMLSGLIAIVAVVAIGMVLKGVKK